MNNNKLERPIFQKPVTFPMFAGPFEDSELSMGARGVLATIRYLQTKHEYPDESFLEKHKGAASELMKKGYMTAYHEFDDTDIVEQLSPEENPFICDISSEPFLFNREELSSKEYAKILSDAMGISWKSSSFCVHHINHDRKNNSVDNLLLLPIKLHKKYHLMELQTKKLREEFSFEGITKDISFYKNKLFAFIYTLSEMEGMKKVQENIIKTKAYCDANGKEFNGVDMFIAGNNEILQKYK